MARPGVRAACCAAIVAFGCSDDREAPRAVRALACAGGSRAGMGSLLSGGGATFRVWAPFALAVSVTGDFNGWGRTALCGEGNGNFSADVAAASAGQKYQFIVKSSWGAEAWKSDPRARRMENSAGASMLQDAASYGWRNGFTLPPRNQQVFYELHVGTFAGTWRGAVAHLDALRDLGIDMIEVMPAFEFPGDVSWGYNPSYPYAPEAAYGSPDDLKYFIDEAHGRGIGGGFDPVPHPYGPHHSSTVCFYGNCLGRGG